MARWTALALCVLAALACTANCERDMQQEHGRLRRTTEEGGASSNPALFLKGFAAGYARAEKLLHSQGSPKAAPRGRDTAKTSAKNAATSKARAGVARKAKAKAKAKEQGTKIAQKKANKVAMEKKVKMKAINAKKAKKKQERGKKATQKEKQTKKNEQEQCRTKKGMAHKMYAVGSKCYKKAFTGHLDQVRNNRLTPQFCPTGKCRVAGRGPSAPGLKPMKNILLQSSSYVEGIPVCKSKVNVSKRFGAVDLKQLYHGLYTFNDMNPLKHDGFLFSDFTEQIDAGNAPGTYLNPEEYMTSKGCIRQCAARGFKFAGLAPKYKRGNYRGSDGKMQIRCLCTQSVGELSKRVSDSEVKKLDNCPDLNARTAKQYKRTTYRLKIKGKYRTIKFPAKTKPYYNLYTMMDFNKPMQGEFGPMFSMATWGPVTRHPITPDRPFWLNCTRHGHPSEGKCAKHLKPFACLLPSIASVKLTKTFPTSSDGPSVHEALFRPRNRCCCFRTCSKFKMPQRLFATKWRDRVVNDKPWLSGGALASIKTQDNGLITVFRTPLPFSEKRGEKKITRTCDFSVADLSCPHGTHISIQSAAYGRTKASFPMKFLCATSSCEKTRNATAAVKRLCHKFMTCKVVVAPRALKLKMPCARGANYLEIHWRCVKGEPSKLPKKAFKAKAFGVQSQKKAMAWRSRGRALPFWAVKLPSDLQSTVTLPPAHILHSRGYPCKFRGQDCGNGEEVTQDPMDKTKCWCMPRPTNGTAPCIVASRSASGVNKVVNICGKQNIVSCELSRHAGGCAAAIDTLTDTQAYVKNGTALTIQFEGKYAFDALQVYYANDDSNSKTKPANQFTANVQCLWTHPKTKKTSWRHMGKIVRYMPRGLAAGWSDVRLGTHYRGCSSHTWRLADVISVSRLGEVAITDLKFVGRFVAPVSSLPPINNDPCGFAMSINLKSKPRPIITTLQPASFSKCYGRARSRHRLELGESKSAPRSLVCSSTSSSRAEANAECPLHIKRAPVQLSCVKRFRTAAAAGAACSLNLGSALQLYGRRKVETASKKAVNKRGAKEKRREIKSFKAYCYGASHHQQVGRPDCSKITDLNGNTGIAVKPIQHCDIHNRNCYVATPTIKLMFSAAANFQIAWVYKHPTVHKRRQIHSFTLNCDANGSKKQVAHFDLKRNAEWSKVKSGWVKLGLKEGCPAASTHWEFTGMQGYTKWSQFYIFDMLLGNDDEERELLPTPASNKINGYCVTHQRVDTGDGWTAMRWQRDTWQQVLSFKPKVDKIPPASTLFMQLMFDKTRTDWSSWVEQKAESAGGGRGCQGACSGGLNNHANAFPPYCKVSLTRDCSGVVYPGLGFEIMDDAYTGVSYGSGKGFPGHVNDKWLGFSKLCGGWAESPDTCVGSDGKVPHQSPRSTSTSGTLKGKPAFHSQQCESCSTALLASRLTEFQAGQNITISMQAPVDKKGYGDLVYRWPHHEWTKPGPNWKHRCAFNGDIHLTFWYKPPSDTQPCV